MNDSQTFRFAGVSRRNGTFKARFANDQMRVKVLAKTGSSDIDLIELKEPMTKTQAIEFLLSINFDNGNQEIREALERDLDKRIPKVKEPKVKAEKPVKEPKVKVAKVKAEKPVKEPKAKKAKAEKVVAETDGISLNSIMAKLPRTTMSKEEILAQMEVENEDAPF